MLSQQSKYAIRGVLYLAMHASKKHKLGSREVGEKIQVPQPFLAKIFQKLNREKLITSVKGPHGGFYLSDEQLSGNLMAVIRCIDGTDALNLCLLGLPQCSEEHPCAIHKAAAPLREKLNSEFSLKTIADFALDAKKSESEKI